MLRSHYDRVGAGPVAYLDETYHVDSDGRSRFYVIAAVVVLAQDRDPLRKDLDALVADGWWHTTNALRADGGRKRVQTLLRTFQSPEEVCVLVEKTMLDSEDTDGAQGRAAALQRLLIAVHTAEHGTHPPVDLVVIEEQQTSRRKQLR